MAAATETMTATMQETKEAPAEWRTEQRAKTAPAKPLSKQETGQKPHTASFYKTLPKGAVQCKLCNRFCAIKPGETGFCAVRKNIGGKLYSLVYGRTLTLTVDPIEKKPLFHFRPGTTCSGVSTYGCNFRCPFCQNWHISQGFDESAIQAVPYTPPEEIVRKTAEQGVPGIAYTYTEPTVFAEYALDTMKIAHEHGLYNVWVSNGYTSREALDTIIPYLDAINIDLKGDDKFYEELCYKVKRGKVLENIKYLHKKGVHVEVTNLVVPNRNDTDADFRDVAEFIAGISREIPLHFSRFFPHWKMKGTPPTAPSTLERAKRTAEKAGLHYVYLGNLMDPESTACKKCGNLLVRRVMHVSEAIGMDGNRCKKCGAENNFVV